MANDIYNISKYLKKVSDTFQNSSNKSISEILNDFSYMSEDYQNSNKLSTSKTSYSNFRFDLCTKEEQEDFINKQLQLIETLVTNKIYDKVGVIWNWYEIYELMNNPEYKTVDKINRKVIFPTASENRPIGDISYSIWNGLQIIDIDIKNEYISKSLKELLFNDLKKYNWFLGVSLSSSGKSLHVWTKITPLSRDLQSRRVEFRCNFRQKYSYIYIILLKYCTKLGYTKEDIISYMDKAMAKPQQGIFISSDNGYINTNFKDLRLDATFEAALDTGIESINWITHPDLKVVFNKLEWFDNDTYSENNVNTDDLVDVGERDEKKSHGPKHYKHAQRWQLANTLTALYGPEKAIELLIEICTGTDKKELKGDVRTASNHKKPISKWAVEELNARHGFNIKLKNEEKELEEKTEKVNEQLKDETVHHMNSINRLSSNNTKNVHLYLTKDQYLSDIKDDILKNLSHITLLEAGAGYGKTEMIKAFKAKTLLILPFTSTIKAKVESSETTKDWLYFYGKEKPTFDDLIAPGQSMTMTIDKFSHLNLMELDEAQFEYIVVDESHLLFTSSYRDVMSPTIQRLANCKSKVIMMTGTPTAEVLFFPNITHIIVKKEETRVKDFTVYMCESEVDQLAQMCLKMTEDIKNGIKILYPTNKGMLYYEQVTSLLRDNLSKLDNPIELKSFYYKKSQYGEESMNNINLNKTIGDNHIVFCSTYLSVGVDIEDKDKFSVYFNELWIGQDIEQFANRLRRNDLHIKLFLPRKKDGISINWDYCQDIDLKLDSAQIMFARDLARTANDMIERNNEESKYNPLIQSLLISNKYLKYDETDCKYYIDETTYKLKVFEERYSEYAKQLPILSEDMLSFGYTVQRQNITEYMSEAGIEDFKANLASKKHVYYDEYTAKVKRFLSHVDDNNIDMYRELLQGNYALFKDDKFIEERGDNNLYVESIEVMEKNVPFVLNFYRFYTIDTIKDIYDFCIESKSNRINYAKLNRIKRFVTIQYNRGKKKLDFPILKFVKDAQEFARNNPQVTKDKINKWVADYTIAYVNSIEGLVVDDTDYLDNIFNLCMDLWQIVIVQSRPVKGKIIIKPFELTWDRKDILTSVYGDANTKEFLLQELEETLKDDEFNDDDFDYSFELKSKVKLADIENQLSDIIHDEFDYSSYSEKDNSNDRFLRKQTNTARLKELLSSDTGQKIVEENIEKTSSDLTLFNN